MNENIYISMNVWWEPHENMLMCVGVCSLACKNNLAFAFRMRVFINKDFEKQKSISRGIKVDDWLVCILNRPVHRNIYINWIVMKKYIKKINYTNQEWAAKDLVSSCEQTPEYFLFFFIIVAGFSSVRIVRFLMNENRRLASPPPPLFMIAFYLRILEGIGTASPTEMPNAHRENVRLYVFFSSVSVCVWVSI